MGKSCFLFEPRENYFSLMLFWATEKAPPHFSVLSAFLGLMWVSSSAAMPSTQQVYIILLTVFGKIIAKISDRVEDLKELWTMQQSLKLLWETFWYIFNHYVSLYLSESKCSSETEKTLLLNWNRIRKNVLECTERKLLLAFNLM